MVNKLKHYTENQIEKDEVYHHNLQIQKVNLTLFWYNISFKIAWDIIETMQK